MTSRRACTAETTFAALSVLLAALALGCAQHPPEEFVAATRGRAVIANTDGDPCALAWSVSSELPALSVRVAGFEAPRAQADSHSVNAPTVSSQHRQGEQTAARSRAAQPPGLRAARPWTTVAPAQGPPAAG